jgi:hypothetical protein
MKCNNCGIENKDDAKFCANCGSELQRLEEPKNTKTCFNCGFENTRDAKFCASCGVELRRHHPQQPQHPHQHQKQPKKKEKRVDTRLKWHPAKVVLLIIGGVILFLSIPYITGNPPGRKQRPEPLIEQRSSDPKLEANVQAVASKFICSCGTCGEQPLDICTCNTAIQERQFIRNALQAGQTSDQVIAAVNTTFGWMKPEFVAHYDSMARNSSSRAVNKGNAQNSPGKPTISTKLKVPMQPESITLNSSQLKALGNRIATAFDRDEIFSRFRCPCGQCGIDDLAKCTCDHPRGAKEVKAFVDQKISEQKYTVAQLIDQLDKQYGGRKF